MRWVTFAITAYLLLALETGLRTLWSVPWAWDASPSLLLILLVYLGLWAPPWKVAWAAVILGLLGDLYPRAVAGAQPDIAVLGPTALGFAVGAYVLLQLRTMVFRDSLVTMAVMTFVTGLCAHLLTVAMFVLRGLHLPWISGFLADSPLPGWSTSQELLLRFLGLLYTTILAVPVGWLLLKTHKFWAFDPIRGLGEYQE